MKYLKTFVIVNIVDNVETVDMVEIVETVHRVDIVDIGRPTYGAFGAPLILCRGINVSKSLSDTELVESDSKARVFTKHAAFFEFFKHDSSKVE